MKTKLTKVTFTGADDTVDPARLLALSGQWADAGFDIEWGILIGSQSGHRFPSHEWIVRLLDLSAGWKSRNLALHICGRHLRKIAIGKRIDDELEFNIHRFHRCQLNWHAENQGDIATHIHRSFHEMRKWQPEIIFQLDGVNNGLALECHLSYQMKVAGLHDLSHGAGVLPEKWPDYAEPSAYPLGYAGGLGPDNLREELPKIDAVAREAYWIDMETKLFDGLQFSLIRCTEVLEIVHDFVLGRETNLNERRKRGH